MQLAGLEGAGVPVAVGHAGVAAAALLQHRRLAVVERESAGAGGDGYAEFRIEVPDAGRIDAGAAVEGEGDVEVTAVVEQIGIDTGAGQWIGQACTQHPRGEALGAAVGHAGGEVADGVDRRRIDDPGGIGGDRLEGVGRKGDGDLAGGEIAFEEVAEGIAAGQAQHRQGDAREPDAALARTAQGEFVGAVGDRLGIQHKAGDRGVADVDVAQVCRGWRGHTEGVGRAAGAAVGEADGAGNQGDVDAAACVTTQREIAEGGAGWTEPDRGLGGVEAERVSGRIIDPEFGSKVVDAVEFEHLAWREAEGDIEEAAIIERGQADQPAIGRAGDVAGRALDGEALRACTVAQAGYRDRVVAHRAGGDRDLDRAVAA